MRATWFETRGVAALLTMRDSGIILGGREYISDLILRSALLRASRRMTPQKPEDATNRVRLIGERSPDHSGQIGFAIRLGEQQDSGVEPAVMDDGVFGVARGKQHL